MKNFAKPVLIMAVGEIISQARALVMKCIYVLEYLNKEIMHTDKCLSKRLNSKHSNDKFISGWGQNAVNLGKNRNRDLSVM